jgi:putative NIF3 family GTP cyclohydrolase 1 type 2
VTRISRRQFVALAATGAAIPCVPQHRGAAAAMTAQAIVERITAALGVEWRAGTVDTFKAGDPATAVTGIVTTALPSMEVLRQAATAGHNLIITAGPTFYSKADSATPPAGRGGPPASDRVFAAKADFIRTHNLVVWRFSEHWRLRRPDPFVQGLTEMLGWPTSHAADDPARVAIPRLTLEALVSHVTRTLAAAGGVRVIGDPRMQVQTVGLLPGSSAIQASLGLLPAVDVIVAGEVREWEAVEYVRDAVAAGQKKGLVLVGRILSEEPGMRACAAWLQSIVRDTPVTWIPSGDPYWRPL